MSRTFLILIALAGLTGCSVASQVYNATTTGNLSCEQIRSTFNAYEADRQSAEAAAALSSMISVGTGNIGNQIITSSDSYYAQARESANLALIVKGCAPL